MNAINVCDAAYLAGLIDADGTVTLTRKHRYENRHAAVSISNTDKNLLKFVAGTIGAGEITGKRIVRSNHCLSFVFSIYNRQALLLLECVYPFLHTYKARRAEIMLRDYLALTPRNGKYTDEMRLARRAFEDEVLAIKPG